MSGNKFGSGREEKIDRFLDNLSWYFSSKEITNRTAKQIARLTSVIERANESSANLARALNRLTMAGLIIALLALLLEGIKLFT